MNFLDLFKTVGAFTLCGAGILVIVAAIYYVFDLWPWCGL